MQVQVLYRFLTSQRSRCAHLDSRHPLGLGKPGDRRHVRIADLSRPFHADHQITKPTNLPATKRERQPPARRRR